MRTSSASVPKVFSILFEVGRTVCSHVTLGLVRTCKSSPSASDCQRLPIVQLKLSTTQQTVQSKACKTREGSNIMHVCFMRNTHAWLGSRDTLVLVWDLGTAEVVQMLEGHKYQVSCMVTLM